MPRTAVWPGRRDLKQQIDMYGDAVSTPGAYSNSFIAAREVAIKALNICTSDLASLSSLIDLCEARETQRAKAFTITTLRIPLA